MRAFVLLLLCLLLSRFFIAQDVTDKVVHLETLLDSVIENTMEREHIPGAAFIIVKDGKTLLKKGYGYTSLGEEIQNVNPDSTIFRIGSVSKTFTAMAFLQLVEQKKIDLQDPVNKHLKNFQIDSSFKPILLEHLVNHSAGFDELSGRRVFDSTQTISLKTFLKDRLVPIREPGQVSSYSSYGIALAGLLVEEWSGQPLEHYLKEHIWDPIQMSSTSMKLTEAIENRVSWGYEYRNGINVPMPWEYYHTYPASDINSTVTDMGNYMITHLNDGEFAGNRILSKESSLKMQNPSLRIHKRVSAFAHGFYEEDVNGFRTVSHGGDMLGYASYLALVPEEDLGVFVVHHHEGGRLRYAILNTILSYIENNNPKTSFLPMAQPTDLSIFQGRYQWATHCHSCETGWKPEIHELKVNTDQTLSIFGRTFYQVEPLLFRSTDGERTLAFAKDSTGAIRYMSTGAIDVFEKIK